jgi:hypothetical protein
MFTRFDLINTSLNFSARLFCFHRRKSDNEAREFTRIVYEDCA